MEAVLSIHGHGGWPMSVFLTPELKPFYGGTYFPRDQFLSLLSQLAQAWKDRPEVLTTSAEELTRMLHREAPQRAPSELSEKVFERFLDELDNRFDSVYGGFSQAPKFPPSLTLSALLRIYERSKDERALECINKTFINMAQGGLYDHLGGGFHRYSTDKKWLVPHFEKMLYDNALLVPAYLEAFQLTKNEFYLSTARDTLLYILEEMSQESGGYYSAEDAGEVGKEGEYYVWREEELKAILSEEELTEVKRLYGVNSLGNFEHGQNILNLQEPHFWQEKYSGHARAAFEKMRDVRSQRHAPHRDEKILTSWNGLMISAMSRGYLVTRDVAYLNSATAAARFIKSNLCQGDELLHRYYEGNSGVSGMLDDYAFLIQGLLDLYQASGDAEWYAWALRLEETTNRLFWDEEWKGYYSTSERDSSLLIRQKELHDGAEPSGNGIMARNLTRLLGYEYQEERKQRIEQLFLTFSRNWDRHISAFPSAVLAFDLFLGPTTELVISGDGEQREVSQLLEYLSEQFLPRLQLTWAGSGEDAQKAPESSQGKIPGPNGLGFYLCRERSCLPREETAEAVIKILEERASK